MYGLFETLRNLGIGTRHSLAIPVTESGNALRESLGDGVSLVCATTPWL